jgi:hypothetical protein
MDVPDFLDRSKNLQIHIRKAFPYTGKNMNTCEFPVRLVLQHNGHMSVFNKKYRSCSNMLRKYCNEDDIASRW